MFGSKTLVLALTGLALMGFSTLLFAGAEPMHGAGEPASTSFNQAASAQTDSSLNTGIPPGTSITMQNWERYRQFMPDGMIALFEGKYFWKMPSDVRIDVGPTIIHSLPRNYLAATEKYAGQVRIVELPNGGLNLTGYQGGIPFPSPA